MQELDCGYLTPSRIREYHECPACFFERYIGVIDEKTGKRVKREPEGETIHISLLMAEAVHAATDFGRERMMKTKKFTMAEVVHQALEAYNEKIAKQKGLIIFEGANVTSLEEAAKEIAGLARAVVTKLLPTEVGEGRIVSVGRKPNYAGIFDFPFHHRVEAQAHDGCVKELKTSVEKLDYWLRFSLLCGGLADYCADMQNPRLDPIQIDQVKKNDDYRIFSYRFQMAATDYEEARTLVLKTFDAIQLLRLDNPRPSDKCKFIHPTLGQAGVELPVGVDFEYLLPERAKKEAKEVGRITTTLDMSDLEAAAAVMVVQEEVSLL